jgi:hypothetical protein
LLLEEEEIEGISFCLFCEMVRVLLLFVWVLLLFEEEGRKELLLAADEEQVIGSSSIMRPIVLMKSSSSSRIEMAGDLGEEADEEMGEFWRVGAVDEMGE